MTITITPHATANPYLEQNVLHFKPLSSRAFTAFQHLYAFSRHINIQTPWQDKCVKALFTGLTITGYLSAIILGLIEGIAFTSLGLIGMAFQALFTKNSDFIEKYSIKLAAYGLNSFTTFTIGILSLSQIKSNEWGLPKLHSTATIIDHSIYMGTAALAQLFCGAVFNAIRNEVSKSPLIRANCVIIEATPSAFKDIVNSLSMDYSLITPEQPCDPETYANDFINAFPSPERDWLRDFDLQAFLRDQTLGPLFALIEQYTTQHQFIDGEAVVDSNRNEIILNPYSNPEKIYHNHLKECVKEAVHQMSEQGWAKFLDVDNNFEAGMDALKDFDAGVTLPLANIAQYLEITHPIRCPYRFTHPDLLDYNTPSRLEKLQLLHATLATLSENDQKLLVEKLIKLSDFSLHDRSFEREESAELIYRSICDLSGHLHCGKLLTLPTIDLNNLEGGGENYFGNSWREGIEMLQENN
jgi:hypothetical protein